jgi:hypothetical protein
LSQRRSSAGRSKASAWSNQGQYRTVGNSLAKKIDSFKMLYAQTQGRAKYARPSPSTLNSFANWIGKGAVVHLVSAAQLARWARSRNVKLNARNPSAATCKSILCSKFGKSFIKAVARTKTGSFMVATSATWNGRQFTFPR